MSRESEGEEQTRENEHVAVALWRGIERSWKRLEKFCQVEFNIGIQPLASASHGTSVYEHGLDVISLDSPLPLVAYFASIPVSHTHPHTHTHTSGGVVCCGTFSFSFYFFCLT